MKNRIRLCSLILGAMLLSGCTNDKKAETNTLYLKNNGNIIGAVVEKLDQEYYDPQELEEWIQDEVDAYNHEDGKDKIKIRKNEVEDDQAKVNIIYASVKDYADFNQVTAFQGTVAEAEEAGYEFNGKFKSTADKPSITEMEIKGSKEYKVLILEECQKLQMNKKILYASDNVEVSKGSHKTADIIAEKENLAYIIYK